jgi:hypothetical protein
MTPIRVPKTEPTPPEREVPPMTTPSDCVKFENPGRRQERPLCRLMHRRCPKDLRTDR